MPPIELRLTNTEFNQARRRHPTVASSYRILPPETDGRRAPDHEGRLRVNLEGTGLAFLRFFCRDPF